MVTLMILPFLFGNFVQRWYLPQGVNGFGNTIMQITDTDRDTHLEFVFTTYGSWPPYIHIYELHLPDSWQVDSVPYSYAPLLWDSGDFDLDGLSDLIMQCGSTNPYWVGITIFESPDSLSYPTQEVWRDTVKFALVTPICVYDIDQDNLPEISKVCGYYTDLEIYESIGNNTYEHIATITTPSTHTASSTVAFGDFDADNQNEFVWGYTGGEYSVWECIGDNLYQELLFGQLPTVNINDCFSVPDADGDGKPELVVKGFEILNAQIHAFIFEATSDNTYEIIKTFTLYGGDYYGGYSDVGDVDGDGIPEIVLEGRQTVHIIKAAGNDSFYIWEALPGNNSGSSVRVFDIDGNGFSEIIISGNNQTRIYEYEVGIVEATSAVPRFPQLIVSPNPFRTHTQIKYMTGANQNPLLKIYDRTGRLVKSFSLESSIGHQESGVVWDGLDNYGNPLPVGVYFVYIRSSRGEQSVPVILLR